MERSYDFSELGGYLEYVGENTQNGPPHLILQGRQGPSGALKSAEIGGLPRTRTSRHLPSCFMVNGFTVRRRERSPFGARGRTRTSNISLLRRATLPIGLRAHWCPHPDSNRDWTDFKSAGSTGWPMRAWCPGRIQTCELWSFGTAALPIGLQERSVFGGEGGSRTPKAVRLARFSKPVPSPHRIASPD